METQEFMRTVLGERGSYCIFAIKGDNRKQKFFSTIERAYDAAEDFDDMGYETYYGLATFDDQRTRKAKNTVEMGSLFLDLDCGEEKDYPDQGAALLDLRRFVKDTGLPRPLMVSSGYGIHAYWPLTEPSPTAEWIVVAKAFKALCRKHKLLIDPSVPADAARVLRLPGTHNHKYGNKVRVDVLGTGAFDARPLSYYADLFGADMSSAVPDALSGALLSVEDDPVMQRLMQSRTSSFKKIMQKTAAGRGCAQLEMIVVDQAGTDEPLWRAGLSIAKHCEEGRKAAHRISRDHPQYDEEETDNKIDSIKGPYTCESFNDLREGVCEGCPFWGKIKSPIVLGHDIKEAEEEEPEAGEPVVVYKDGLPKLPRGYVRGQTGVYKVQVMEDGTKEKVLVYMHDFYYTSRVVDPELGECIVARLHLPRDGVRDFTVPLVAATSKEELRKALSKHGMTVGSKQWEMVMGYTQAWIEKLQEEDAADMARTQFGWTDEHLTSYAIGDREITATSIDYNPPSSKTSFMFPAFKKKGTLEGWKEQAKFYDRTGLEPFQFVICQALAAPLMRFTAVKAAIFDFYSDGSGHGKSTTQRFALTAYGDPDELIVGPKDTFNARMNRMELMKDVNVQYDEFTEYPAQETSDLIYGITDGKQKARMAGGSNEERHRGQPWATTVTASSNHSMLAKVYSVKGKPDAEVQRVLRYHVQPYNFTAKTETDVFAKEVGEHRGHAIEVFVQAIIQRKEEVKHLIETMQRKLDKDCGLTMANRFWSVQGAVTLAALVLARDLGLLTYDVRTLYQWTVDLIVENKRGYVEAAPKIDSILTEFIAEHYGEVLWIRGDEAGLAANGNGLDNLVVPEMLPRGKLVARYETDTKLLFIVLRPFKVWCSKRRFNFDSIMAEATKNFKAEKKRVRISRGTKMNLPPVDAFEIPCEGLGLEEVVSGGANK